MVKQQMVVEDLKPYLVGGFSPTHLKNMRKSNWIISPVFGVKIDNYFKSPPSQYLDMCLLKERSETYET